jgi:hypothetical protein
MFIDLKEYMTKSREERRAHLRLDEPCHEIGGYQAQMRGILAYFLGTTIKLSGAYCCHGCNNCLCSNPRHLYFGTPTDNALDAIKIGCGRRPKKPRLIDGEYFGDSA